jgi:predicted acylesterase/phospholipase RssA
VADRLTDADICHRLTLPLVADAPPHTLRLGLVLSGTVSAGAWTAGALDALVEALDAWEAAKARGEDVPRHALSLEMAGGTSGGAVCAALLARAGLRRFPHARDEAGASGNPFWKVWVETLDIGQMLETSALAAGRPVDSLLSGRAIERAVEAILGWEGLPLEAPRPWLARPFRALVTVTDLEGVPHELELSPSPDSPDRPRRARFSAHADHAIFAVGPAIGLREDEFHVAPDDAAQWRRLASYARASGAFPIGFPPVRLERPRGHYRWRAVLAPDGRGGMEPRLLRPCWPDGREDGPPRVFDAADGGALNNSPFALVHQRMVGLGKSLPRRAEDLTGAILLLDPLAALAARAAPPEPPTLGEAAGALVNALVSHARYSAAELLLAADGEVESRQIVTAGRTRADGGRAWGDAALATSGAAAFLGFLDRRLRAHDFLLGRANMLAWLDRYFRLPAGARLFAGGGEGRFLRAADNTLPVVPLCGIGVPAPPPWPAGGGPDVRALRAAAEQRLRETARALVGRGLLGHAAGYAAGALLSRRAAAGLEEALKDLAARR